MQIRVAIGVAASSWARRVRELRKDESWPIQTHEDAVDLKPGQYRLREIPPLKRVVFKRGISAKLRAEVLDLKLFDCQMCGLGSGEVDDATGRTVKLHIGHIVGKNLGGKDELSDLRALCTLCNQGARYITSEKPNLIWLLSQVRRASQEEQRAVLSSLMTKFAASK